jgi:hypothetical protein
MPNELQAAPNGGYRVSTRLMRKLWRVGGEGLPLREIADSARQARVPIAFQEARRLSGSARLTWSCPLGGHSYLKPVEDGQQDEGYDGRYGKGAKAAHTVGEEEKHLGLPPSYCLTRADWRVKTGRLPY